MEHHHPTAPGPARDALHPTHNTEGQEFVAAHGANAGASVPGSKTSSHNDEKLNVETPGETQVDVEAYRTSEDTEEARQNKISEGWNAFRKSKASTVARDMFMIALIVSCEVRIS